MGSKNKNKQQNFQQKKQITIEKKDNNQLKIHIGLILILTFIVFSPALKNQFLYWDDHNYLEINPYIKSLSIDNIKDIFYYKTFVMGNYHPLTILSYAIEYKFFGLNPFYYHLNNILLHLFNVVLVLWIVWLLTKRYYTMIITAALFALHPMRVESVVWAAERKDVLYALFYLLSLLFYIFHYTKENDKIKNLILSLLFFICSILAKGQAVVLPLTFILIDFWYEGKFTVRMIVNKLPFFIISIAFGVLAVVAQSSSLTEQRLASYSFFERIVFANYNILAYLYKLIFPYNLACFYGYPPKAEMTFFYITPVIVIALFLWIFIKNWKNKMLIFGSLFFLSTIFIVIQLLPIGNAIIADRYTYIPYIGLFFILGELGNKALTENLKYKKIISWIIVIQLIVFGFASFKQSQTWKNNQTIWQQALKINPNEPVAHNNLALHYMDLKDYKTAIFHLEQSIKNKETYSEFYMAINNLGKAYSETGRPEEAIKTFTEAITIAPAFVNAIFNRGLTFTEMGKFNLAIVDFTTIVTKYNPNHPEAFYSRAIAYKAKGNLDSAILDYSQAIAIRPNYIDAITNLGNIYFSKSNFDKAIEFYNKSLTINPKDANTILNRSKSWFLKGEFAKALIDAQLAESIGLKDEQYLAFLKAEINKQNNK